MPPIDLSGPESLGEGVGLRPDGGASEKAAPGTAPEKVPPGIGAAELAELEARLMRRFEALEASLAQWFEAHLVTSTEAVGALLRRGRPEDGPKGYRLIKPE